MVIPWDSILSLNRINYYRPAHPSLSYLPSPDFTKPKVLQFPSNCLCSCVKQEDWSTLSKWRVVFRSLSSTSAIPSGLLCFCFVLFSFCFCLALRCTSSATFSFPLSGWKTAIPPWFPWHSYSFSLSLPPFWLCLCLFIHSLCIHPSIHPFSHPSIHLSNKYLLFVGQAFR